MRIVFISNHFSLPDQPGAARPWKVAQYLQQSGHEVIVITNRRHYLIEELKVGATGDRCGQLFEGVRIIGVSTTKGRRKSLARRLLNYASFSYQAYRTGMKIPRIDVVITGTPPIVAPLAGFLLARRKGAYNVIEIRDLYPETAVALRKIKNPVLIRLWEKWENFFRRRADHIVTLVPLFERELLAKGFASEKITTITNGYDLEQDREVPLPGEIEEIFERLKEHFKIVYAGGMGYANELLTVVKAAELLEKTRVAFLFFGDGERKREYLRQVEQRKLNNCFFLPAQPRQVMHEILRRADATTHSFPNDSFWECAFSSKIIEYQGSGKPLIFAGRGAIEDLVKAARSGMTIEPENPYRYADAVRYLASHREEAASMGARGRAYILKHYLRAEIFREWDSVIEKAGSEVS